MDGDTDLHFVRFGAMLVGLAMTKYLFSSFVICGHDKELLHLLSRDLMRTSKRLITLWLITCISRMRCGHHRSPVGTHTVLQGSCCQHAVSGTRRGAPVLPAHPGLPYKLHQEAGFASVEHTGVHTWQHGQKEPLQLPALVRPKGGLSAQVMVQTRACKLVRHGAPSSISAVSMQP